MFVVLLMSCVVALRRWVVACQKLKKIRQKDGYGRLQTHLKQLGKYSVVHYPIPTNLYQHRKIKSTSSLHRILHNSTTICNCYLINRRRRPASKEKMQENVIRLISISIACPLPAAAGQITTMTTGLEGTIYCKAFIQH